uniref:Mothers against decapentaplegic homolog n=2 Tax=Strongyloides papillosus TaxID=174720 RepID=A0A0N5B4G1_STREA
MPIDCTIWCLLSEKRRYMEKLWRKRLLITADEKKARRRFLRLMQGFDAEDLDVLKKAVESGGLDIKQCAPGPPMETLDMELPGSSKMVTNDGEDEVVFDAKYDDSGLIPQIDKPMSMPYLCCKMWRWKELQVDAALHKLELMPWCRFGRVTINNATVSCCNPYHYGLWIKPELSHTFDEDENTGTILSNNDNTHLVRGNNLSNDTGYGGCSNSSEKFSTPKHHSRQHIENLPRPGSIMSAPTIPNITTSIEKAVPAGGGFIHKSIEMTSFPSPNSPKIYPNRVLSDDSFEEYLNTAPPPPPPDLSPVPSMGQYTNQKINQHTSVHSQALTWGRLARWEKKERVGEVISLYGEFIAVGLLAGTVFDSQDIQCDWDIDNEVSFSLIKKSETDDYEDIWLYNSGSRPLFISISSSTSNQKGDTIRRLCNGYCIRVHRIVLCPEESRVVSNVDPANTMSFLTISVGVGWGVNYQKLFLTELPCRYEVIFS